MELTDVFSLAHPALAVSFVFPLIGVVCYFAWQTRQRRLESKSKIPPMVGPEHVNWGRWLTGSVTGLSLLGMAHPIVSSWLEDGAPVGRAITVVGLYALTIGSLVLLLRVKAKEKSKRALFATLAGMGVVIISLQEGVYRRDFEWYVSHYYYGISVTLLMVFSLAIQPSIYQDKTQRWRTVHIILNSLAVLFFIGQGFTGARDLLEIPLAWQKPFVYSCDYDAKVCNADTSSIPSSGSTLVGRAGHYRSAKPHQQWVLTHPDRG